MFQQSFKPISELAWPQNSNILICICVRNKEKQQRMIRRREAEAGVEGKSSRKHENVAASASTCRGEVCRDGGGSDKQSVDVKLHVWTWTVVMWWQDRVTQLLVFKTFQMIWRVWVQIFSSQLFVTREHSELQLLKRESDGLRTVPCTALRAGSLQPWIPNLHLMISNMVLHRAGQGSVSPESSWDGKGLQTNLSSFKKLQMTQILCFMLHNLGDCFLKSRAWTPNMNNLTGDHSRCSTCTSRWRTGSRSDRNMRKPGFLSVTVQWAAASRAVLFISQTLSAAGPWRSLRFTVWQNFLMFAGRRRRCTSSAAPAAHGRSCFRAICLHTHASFSYTFLWIYTQQMQINGSRNNPRNKGHEWALTVAVQPALPVRPMASAESVTMKLQISRSQTGLTTRATKQGES